MGGVKKTSKFLNQSLLRITSILNRHNITGWFIAYGTLLGIVRENSCIENDDDIDIICDESCYDNLKKILSNEGFTFENGYCINNSRNIIKIVETDECSTIDFYMATVTHTNGNFYDKWEDVVWSGCYDNNNSLIEREWNGATLYLPYNYVKKLELRYGDWKTPSDFDGNRKHKTI